MIKNTKTVISIHGRMNWVRNNPCLLRWIWNIKSRIWLNWNRQTSAKTNSLDGFLWNQSCWKRFNFNISLFFHTSAFIILSSTLEYNYNKRKSWFLTKDIFVQNHNYFLNLPNQYWQLIVKYWKIVWSQKYPRLLL